MSGIVPQRRTAVQVRRLTSCVGYAGQSELCSAQIQDVQRVGDMVVPYKLVLSWPAEKTKLSMKLNKPTLNQVSTEQANSLFTRVPLKDSPAYDLARLASVNPEERGQLQQAVATTPVDNPKGQKR